MATYTYEGTLERWEDEWLVTVPAFDGCHGGGKSVREACEAAAQSLRLGIATALERGKLPGPEFSDRPGVVLCVDVDDDFIESSRLMTVGEAAGELGVSSSRVSQLLSSGALVSVFRDGRRMVTVDSVAERRANPPAPHRPRG